MVNYIISNATFSEVLMLLGALIFMVIIFSLLVVYSVLDWLYATDVDPINLDKAVRDE